jgi:hypothetical protein
MDLREQLLPPTRRLTRQHVHKGLDLAANDIQAQTRHIVEQEASSMARLSEQATHNQSPSGRFSHGATGVSLLSIFANRVPAAPPQAPEAKARAAREKAVKGQALFGASEARARRPREALGPTPVDQRNDEPFHAPAQDLPSNARETLTALHVAIETQSRELWDAERSLDPTHKAALRQEIDRLRAKAAAVIRAKADAALRPLEQAHERAAAEARRRLAQ